MECFKEGWQLIKPKYWLLFTVSLLGALIGSSSLYVLLGSMVCGIFLCYFRAVDGKEIGIEHLFRGFRYFFPSLLVALVVVVPMAIVLLLVYVPLLFATYMGGRVDQEELMTLLTGTLAVEFAVSIVMVCIHTLLMFAFPLIVDRELSGWRSMIVSAKAVWKNLKGVTGLWAIGFILTLAGMLAFCIGIYFVIPVVVAGNIVAFRKVFPKTVGNGNPGEEAVTL